MSAKPDQKKLEKLRELPSVDEVMRGGLATRLAVSLARKQLVEIVRLSVAEIRGQIVAGEDVPDPATAVENAIEARAAASSQAALRRVINATGVIIHTNLGRAPLSKNAQRAIADASGYCTLEYDLTTGTRGRRSPLAEQLICQLTGAAGALVVNNCAAAAYLVLKAFGDGREVIVSRGELVEIGGDFRVPDILAESGAEMREIGTTNRTKLADYEKAINAKTAVLLRVHPSNYRIVGFTEQPEMRDLAELAAKNDLILYEDLGSGALIDLAPYGIADEPVVAASLEAGVDIVTFSGDKLLGGPQSGIIAGRADLIDRLRRHPLYRALRVDKTIAAALEVTLQAYLNETAVDEIDVIRMLAMKQETIEGRITSLFAKVRDTLGNKGFVVETVEGKSAVGGGAAPNVGLATTLIALSHADLPATAIEMRLRNSSPPVITRIENDRVLIDLRTVSDDEEVELIDALTALSSVL